MTNTEKVAYIRGLVEGLEMDETKKEVKVINAMIDLLDDMAMTLAEVQENCEDMADQLDTVDEDLGNLEEDFYGDDDDCCCGCGDDDEDECYYEVTCPTCNETICLSEEIIEEGQIECPNCGENLEFDIDELAEDCECECGCGHDHKHE